jgi:AcrR family transcriptional regulator
MAETTRGRPSRRERPAKPALTYAGIVAAAVQIMEAEGHERVTMRRLAQVLDTGPASLYVYVRDAAELHAAVLDHMLARADLAPVHSRGDWRDRLAAVLGSYVMVLFEHPALARSALVTRPSGPHTLALIDALLSLLDEGGVPGDQAAWGIDLLLLFATATAAEQATRAGAAGAEAEERASELALRSADPQAFPRIAALAGELLSGPGPRRLAWGLRAVIDGVLHTPLPPDQPPAA